MLANALKHAAVTLIALTLGTGCALAQNYDGTGIIKFGAFAQGNFLDINQTAPVAATTSPSGFAGGVSAGYDFVSRGRWLIGAEVDGSFGDTRSQVGLIDYGFDYLLTLRGRAGVFLHDNWLVYGTAGVGFLGFSGKNSATSLHANDTVTGYVVGGGTEIDFNRFSLFGEYLYGDFGSREFNIGATPALRYRADLESQIVRVGLKFKVGNDYDRDFDHPEDYRARRWRDENLK